jgi:hypothetical protein
MAFAQTKARKTTQTWKTGQGHYAVALTYTAGAMARLYGEIDRTRRAGGGTSGQNKFQRSRGARKRHSYHAATINKASLRLEIETT